MHADLIEVFKITHGYSSVTLDTFFEINCTSRTRGHPWKFKKKRINTDLWHHFVSDCVINWWNKLDHDVVCATSVNAVKNVLILFFFKQQQQQIQESSAMNLGNR